MNKPLDEQSWRGHLIGQVTLRISRNKVIVAELVYWIQKDSVGYWLIEQLNHTEIGFEGRKMGVEGVPKTLIRSLVDGEYKDCWGQTFNVASNTLTQENQDRFLQWCAARRI